MPNRNVHNKIAYELMKNTKSKYNRQKLMKIIDSTNKEMDAPSQWLGKGHRVLHHSTNPTRKDSVLINKGNIDRELARQIHIMLDTDKELKKLLKMGGYL
ncbi:MAG: hypothetical protein ACYDAO_04245 [Thermoplasmataceae archaeon]